MSAKASEPQPQATSALERRYRRLLALYPSAWRAGHGEEVLAVLLECAEPGRQRPPFRDALDLIGHAFAERVRRAGRSLTRDDTRSGVALAGVVALAGLAAVSVLQLVAIVPKPAVWSSAHYSVDLGPVRLDSSSAAPLAAMIASAACLIACACWMTGRRRPSLVAIAFTDAGFLVAAVLIPRGPYVVSWPTVAGVLGLAVLSTLLLVHRRVSEAGRALIGPRGGIELVGALVLVAEVAGWQHVAWAGSVYGMIDVNIASALSIAFLVAAAVSLLLALRNPVPLIAVTVLSPLLLAFGFVPLAKLLLLRDASPADLLRSDAFALVVIAFLVVASLLALRRSRAGAVG